MKSLFACLFATLVLLLGATSSPLAAQEITTATPDCVVAQKGDSLWRIADRELGNPDLWESRLYDRNPHLQRKGRRYRNPKNAWTYVHIGIGEIICGLNELGISREPAGTDELAGMGFKVPKPETVVVTEISPWSYLPLGLLLLFAMIAYGLYRYFRRDPTRVGAGRVREAGIQTPQQAAEYFRQQLIQEHGQVGASLPILSLVRGRGYGWARVIDRLGSFFRRFLNGEVMWQATVRLQNGSQEIRYSLMGCANDVRAAGGMMPGWGFRFVAEENVTEQVRPEQPAQPVPAPAPAPAPAPQTEPAPAPVIASMPEDEMTIEFMPEAGDNNSLVRAKGIDVRSFTFRKTHNEIAFRFRAATKEK